MYKVFFNDSFLLVTSSLPEAQSVEVKRYESPLQLNQWIEIVRNSDNPVRWALITEQVHQTWDTLFHHLPTVEAAGGVVRNTEGKYLFIYRRKRWDLPKGKMDANETPEQTALREVEEETGLSPLKILNFLTHTYHIYLLKDRFTIKRTHWFLMQYSGSKAPVPQHIEDIERAEWMTVDQFLKVQEPVFGTVKDIVISLI
ncbi:MAG: NUDIX domain-containing protein [Bacteroidales bacterium]|nr:NUDIX domain-containing protein [Bacteroidales bacterium]